MKAITYENKIYVVAGLSSQVTTFIFDVDSNTWSTGSRMPNARGYANATCVDGKIYVFGGDSNPTTIDIYDIESNSWETIPSAVWTAYQGLVSHNNIIYMAISNLDIFDTVTNEWTQKPLAYLAWFPQLLYLNDTLYYLGGENNSQVTMYNTMYSLQIGELVPPPTSRQLFVLLNISESIQLSLSHNLGINLDYDWSSTDNSVATVNPDGYVTAQGEGACFIYAENEEGYSDYIPIKVIEGNADEIRLAVHLAVGGTAKLYLAEDPADAIWTSFDDSIVSVDSEGMLTANGRGLAIVQGEIDGEEYHIYVRVNA